MTDKTLAERLAEKFSGTEVLSYTKEWRGKDGREHSMTFDYIEDETVMDRLDEVLGIGAWSVNVEPISVADGIVKVSLEAIVDGKGVVFQDFGYATRTDGEALKEAVSDGIRRCGRFLGVGRYLYHKRADDSSRHSSSQSTGRGTPLPRPAARPTVVKDEPEFAPNDWDDQHNTPIGGPPRLSDNTKCPIHDTEWRGEWGDLFHGPKGVVDGGYCRHPENTRQEGRQRAGARR